MAINPQQLEKQVESVEFNECQELILDSIERVIDNAIHRGQVKRVSDSELKVDFSENTGYYGTIYRHFPHGSRMQSAEPEIYKTHKLAFQREIERRYVDQGWKEANLEIKQISDLDANITYKGSLTLNSK
jgi:hypothetical protein